jgi:hypothetical protein
VSAHKIVSASLQGCLKVAKDGLRSQFASDMKTLIAGSEVESVLKSDKSTLIVRQVELLCRRRHNAFILRPLFEDELQDMGNRNLIASFQGSLCISHSNQDEAIPGRERSRIAVSRPDCARCRMAIARQWNAGSKSSFASRSQSECHRRWQVTAARLQRMKTNSSMINFRSVGFICGSNMGSPPSANPESGL